LAQEDYLELFGAPSARAVAQEFARALDAELHHAGTTCHGEQFTINTGGCIVSIHEWTDVALEPGEGSVLGSVFHVARDAAQQHAITDRLFDHIVINTTWGIESDSDLEDFEERCRPGPSEGSCEI